MKENGINPKELNEVKDLAQFELEMKFVSIEGPLRVSNLESKINFLIGVREVIAKVFDSHLKKAFNPRRFTSWWIFLVAKVLVGVLISQGFGERPPLSNLTFSLSQPASLSELFYNTLPDATKNRLEVS